MRDVTAPGPRSIEIDHTLQRETHVYHMLHLAVAFVVMALATPAFAQGRSDKANAKQPAATKKVTPAGAVGATREILTKHGFVFVRTEQVGTTQVVYYRRGNMGRGKGQGPIEKLVIKPANDLVIFEGAPSSGFMVDIKLRLGL